MAFLTPRFNLLLLALLAAPGCMLADKCKSCIGPTPPKPGPVHQVVTTWSNEVQYVPDPVRNGTPSPALAGRMYLFGEQVERDGTPRAGDGIVTVELYNDSGPQPGAAPIEQWNFDHPTLQRLMKRDTFGWGYTLVLPWGTYRPDLTKVRLMVRYTPAAGSPLFSPSSSMALNHGIPPAGASVALVSAAQPVPSPAVTPAPQQGLMPWQVPQQPQQQLPMPRILP